MEPGSQVTPGEAWQVCGTYLPERQVQVVLHRLGTDLSWFHDPEAAYVVPTGDDGAFCWTGTVPSQMIDELTSDVSPIEPGEWELLTRDANTGRDLLAAKVEILP